MTNLTHHVDDTALLTLNVPVLLAHTLIYFFSSHNTLILLSSHADSSQAFTIWLMSCSSMKPSCNNSVHTHLSEFLKYSYNKKCPISPKTI